MKKIGKAIAKKFKNWETTTSKETVIQEPSISSREEAKKPLEITIEHQPTVVTAKTTTAKDENNKEVHEVYKYSVTNKDTIRVIDKATETDTQLREDINKNTKDLQPTCESKEEVQNASVYTTAREPNTPEIQPSTEPFSGSGKGNSAGEKSPNQSIVVGIVGTALLAGSAVFCALKGRQSFKPLSQVISGGHFFFNIPKSLKNKI